MGENHFAAAPTALYGIVLLMSAIAYVTLQTAIIACNGRDSKLAAAVGNDLKGKVSMAFYLVAIPLAFFAQWIADALFVTVAIIWFLPDRRIERKVAE